MLSKEFPLPDVLRIWDSILSDETRSEFLINVCCAMLTIVRSDILRNEFPDNMKLLQVGPPSCVLTLKKLEWQRRLKNRPGSFCN